MLFPLFYGCFVIRDDDISAIAGGMMLAASYSLTYEG
jgi:hypothetical protein